MMHINAKATPINDKAYNCHITAMELVNQSYGAHPYHATSRHKILIPSGADTHTHTHADTHTHTHTRRHTHTHTQTHTHTHADTQTHADTHVDTHADTHRHTYTPDKSKPGMHAAGGYLV